LRLFNEEAIIKIINDVTKNKITKKDFSIMLYNTSILYNKDRREIIKMICYYLIKQIYNIDGLESDGLESDGLERFKLLQSFKFIIHLEQHIEIEYIISYLYYIIQLLYYSIMIQ
jgi:hypothetical protein